MNEDTKFYIKILFGCLFAMSFGVAALSALKGGGYRKLCEEEAK